MKTAGQALFKQMKYSYNNRENEMDKDMSMRKREVMYMEQLWRIVTEESGLIGLGYGILILLLSAVTLHRMKRNEKRMKNLVEIVESTSLQMEYLTELTLAGGAGNDAAVTENDAANTIPEEAITADEAKNSRAERADAPEVIIDAVLGEIFPDAAMAR